MESVGGEKCQGYFVTTARLKGHVYSLETVVVTERLDRRCLE